METGDLSKVTRGLGVSLAGTGYSLMGMPLSDLVQMATLIYVIFQVIVIIPAVYRVVCRFIKWISDKVRSNKDG